MKTIMTTLGLLLMNISIASNTPSIKNEMIKKVHPDLTDFEFSAKYENFVVVSFKIDNQHLQILEIMGSNEGLIQLMKEELSVTILDKIYPVDDIYYFKFTFKKQ
jgi:hypothetical protein